ncbi:MAG: tyrosine-type recombinase/integrase [Anaerolineales bacterium]|jgi:integrase/recombinase XerD
MNRRPPGLETVKAVQGFLQFKAAEGLSARTIESYAHDLHQWLDFLGERDVGKITAVDIRQYLVYLLTEYEPRRLNTQNKKKLSPKTVRNVWVTLAAFFHWASDELEIPNPIKKVPAPKTQTPPVEPFTREEVEAILKACDYCKEANTNYRHKFSMRRVTGFRDKAIVMMLMDTGLRASELCALRIGDIEMQTGKVTIRHGEAGGAKGKKGRLVYLGKTSRKTLWRYLVDRKDGEDPEAPLFLGRFTRPLTRDGLRQLIGSLGEKAGVKKAHPHRFRHTFAITYLRSGGDLFSLQRLLGHSNLEMVQHYARMADIDVENAHRRASPADNWRL